MFRSFLLAFCLLLGAGSYSATAQGLLDPRISQTSEPDSRANSAPDQSASPATQPVAVVITAEQLKEVTAGGDSITDVFGRTRVGQLFEGRQKVTLADVRDPLFWVDTVKDLIVAVISFVPRVIVALLFLVFFWLIYRGVRKVVVGSMGKASVDPSIRDMLGWLIKWAIMGFGIVIACNQIGVQIAALLTGVSIIGLAVGFAAQETLANFIAGIVIFWDKPFKIGDWVEVDGQFGEVKRVTFRSTRILNLDGEFIIFPNTKMLSDQVSNHTTNPINRVSIPIGIAYKESIDAAREVLLGLTRGDKRICEDPPPAVVVTECANSSVNLELRVWIEDESIERVIMYELIERAKKGMDAAGIQIPYPHLQLFLEQTPAVDLLSPTNLRRAG